MSNSSFCTFVSQIDLDETPIEDSYESIFDQYEKVVVQALVTSFGLDFLIQDRHGGDVDTIYNVRQIGKDPNMTYKNQKNAEGYANRGEYNRNGLIMILNLLQTNIQVETCILLEVIGKIPK